MFKKKKPNSNILQLKQSKSDSIVDLAKRIELLKDDSYKIAEMAARSILKALDAKDHYTYNHSMRVCYFSMVVGRELRLNDWEMYELQMSALFHDIGKIGTPDSILNKPERLDEAEFQVMKKHPVQSYEILNGFKIFEEVAIHARHHHERFDGRGYPDGLAGNQIPFYARIILIADTFDAMTSTRVYRKGLSYDIAFAELIEFSGSQFDPELVNHFINGMSKEQEKNEDEFYIPLMNQSFKKDAA